MYAKLRKNSPEQVWLLARIKGQLAAMRKKHGALSDAQRALVKRLAMVQTGKRIIEELGGSTSLYASKAEFEREKGAVEQIK